MCIIIYDPGTRTFEDAMSHTLTYLEKQTAKNRWIISLILKDKTLFDLKSGRVGLLFAAIIQQLRKAVKKSEFIKTIDSKKCIWYNSYKANRTNVCNIKGVFL